MVPGSDPPRGDPTETVFEKKRHYPLVLIPYPPGINSWHFIPSIPILMPVVYFLKKEYIMQQKQSVERLITPCELTEILGLKRSCIYKILRSGELPCVRVTTGERKLSLRVRPSTLGKWMK